MRLKDSAGTALHVRLALSAIHINQLAAAVPDPLARLVKETPAEPLQPHGEVVIRTIAMPADANSNGDIFGGWLMSQMDLGGAILARGTAHCRVTTAAVDGMSFLRPVNVGDIVTCHAQLLGIGRTSMRIAVEAWVQRYADTRPLRVTEGTFTYVAIDETGKPQPVKR